MRRSKCHSVLLALLLTLACASAQARDFVLGGSVVAATTGPVSFSLLANNPAAGLDPFFTTSVLYSTSVTPTFPDGVGVRGLFSSGNPLGSLYTLPGLDLPSGGFTSGVPKNTQFVFQLTNIVAPGTTVPFSSVSTADPSGWVDRFVNPGSSQPNQAVVAVQRGNGFVDIGFPARVVQSVTRFLDYPLRLRVFNACLK